MQMAKGYWIVRVDVNDPEQYAKYAAANGAAYVEFGGRVLVRGGEFELMEGDARPRNVVIEFPSYDDAVACYRSDAYQSARELRKGASVADLIVIGGYEGPQPGE
ncbi:MAG: DUF1330 domain-containing protein [Allobranchiibius sp.]